ncbi:MAG: glycosyltransferase family 4 protein [Anaerolineae bacterium]|nr:glycosyltransferase family 4 protein [Anaerolineae bacterium]
MTNRKRALIVEENSYVPVDIRVWYEAMALRDAGWDVAVICPFIDSPGKQQAARTKEPETIDGVQVYRFPLTFAEQGMLHYLSEYMRAFVSIARLTRRVWRDGRFDVIQFCNPPDIFFPIALTFRLRGAGVVFDHHDLFPEMVLSRFGGLGGRLLYGIARLTERLTFRCAHVVMSTNQSYRRIAIERGRISPERVVVVRNGPQLDRLVPIEPDPALKRGMRYMACYVGVMGYQDGVLEMLDSIRHIVQTLGRRDVFFALLGDGAIREQALAKITAWGLEEVVDMPGMVRDDQRLRRYLSTADVCLAPEPLSPLNAHSTFIKVGEYMAMGKPVVAYDLTETRYTAQEAAVYVTPGDVQGFGQAVLDLLEDPERRKQMGELGRQRVLSELSWKHQEPQLLRAYALALGQSAESAEQ